MMLNSTEMILVDNPALVLVQEGHTMIFLGCTVMVFGTVRERAQRFKYSTIHRAVSLIFTCCPRAFFVRAQLKQSPVS